MLKGALRHMIINNAIVAFLAGVALLWAPEAHGGQAASLTTHAASCRDSRLPPRSKKAWEEGPHLRLEVDMNGDGFVDVLEVTDSLAAASVARRFGLLWGEVALNWRRRRSLPLRR